MHDKNLKSYYVQDPQFKDLLFSFLTSNALENKINQLNILLNQNIIIWDILIWDVGLGLAKRR